MESKWIRQRQIVGVPVTHDWWVSHAQLPTVFKVSDNLWRIFVAGRDAKNRGSIVALDVDPGDDMAVKRVSQERLIDHGRKGQFDCDGIGVTSVLYNQDGPVFISAGMNANCGEHYQISIGLLASPDQGKTFARMSDGPILGPGDDNPHGCSSGQAVIINGVWHIWFVSWREWVQGPNGSAEPRYDIRHATSKDGVKWVQDPQPAIALANEFEGGLARPWVMPARNGFEMWYSVRGRFDTNDATARRYKLGYAVSDDAVTWTRKDDAHSFTPAPQPSDWDYEMQCYASIILDKNRSYMFYCGNDHGRFGIGYAVRSVPS